VGTQRYQPCQLPAASRPAVGHFLSLDPLGVQLDRGRNPSTVGGAGIGSPPTCCAPGWPSATSKDALVWIGAPRRLTNGKTR
jgi:hypothetical protein